MPTSFAPLILCVAALTLFACSSSGSVSNSPGPSTSSAHRAASTDAPLPVETSPPGDIPDTQAFVSYTSTNGRVAVAYPEGWQRTARGAEVTFVQDFDGERIRVGSGPGINAAMRDLRTSVVRLPGGPATLLVYTSNSLPNAVTGKRVRLLNNTYVLKTVTGKVALDLWAPQGADNIDQWRHIASTFRAR